MASPEQLEDNGQYDLAYEEYKKLYANSLNSEITFIIPVYNNMPASNPMPQDIRVQAAFELNKIDLNLN